MSTQTDDWKHLRTDETRNIEQMLRQHFELVDAYRYNSASIRIRIIESRFKGLGREARDDIVEPYLSQLDPSTQADIMNLFLFYPEEARDSFRARLMDEEFDHPGQSML